MHLRSMGQDGHEEGAYCDDGYQQGRGARDESVDPDSAPDRQQ